jgi:phosphatidylglycerol:prolipoprotein diacylglycerol transferase
VPTPPDPIAFTIPGIDHPVYWYGLMVTLGTLAGAYVADREARRRGHNPDHVWNALILVMIFGLLGARLYHVLSAPADSGSSLEQYLRNPLEIVAFWDGGLRGLGIFGAVLGGIFGLWVYTRLPALRRRRGALGDAPPREPLRFAEWADIAAVGVPLGQAIGRWGNYFNQELYGNPTTLPWGVPIAPEYRLPRFQDLAESARFHPTFLYESLWNLLVFFVLLYAARNWGERLRAGDLALVYGILYPLGRYFVELQRPDAWLIAGVPAAQLLSVAVMVVSAIWLLARHGVFRQLRRRAVEV